MFFARGGFSIQPCLLAGLVPHLDRDEPEIAIWMFFNALLACYREENEGMTEHPLPELGYSNAVAWKTSDEANAVMWLRMLIVYSAADVLHVGRALPRAWLRDGEEVSLSSLWTIHGTVDARYRSRHPTGASTVPSGSRRTTPSALPGSSSASATPTGARSRASR